MTHSNKKTRNKCFKKIAYLAIALIVLFQNGGLQAQTCTSLVGGTHFQPLPGSEDAYYYDFNLVKQIGPSGNTFSSAATIAVDAEDFSTTNFVYGATANPNKLRTDFADIKDSMLVIRLETGTDKPLLSYKVNGVKPGSNYTVRMKIYHLPVMDSACMMANQWTQSNLRIGVNVDQYGAGLKDFSLGSGATSWGQSFNYTSTGTLAADATSIILSINSGYNFGRCSAIGIGKIEVFGCLDPKIKSSQGREVCTGEQTLLSLDREYGAKSYQWQKSTNGGSSWTNISTNKSAIVEVTENALYRITMDGTVSEPYDIKTVTCCVNDLGMPSSRETIFFDDFGRFPTANSYIDAFGNTTTGLTKPFRANVGYTIPSHKFDGTGTIEDGFYGVSSYIHKNVGNWFAGVYEDHSQEPDGGQLFINVAYNFLGVVYSRTIPNLCEGKQMFFEAYIANASDAVNAPTIKLNIKSPNGAQTLATATATAGPGSGWVRVSVPSFTLNGYTSVLLEVDSRGGEGTSGDAFWRNGNDLLIDDIKFMACAPPTLDLFADLPTFSKYKKPAPIHWSSISL
ncbi:MAG: hypothetical protein IPO21_14015 [Bacteroidales bacterium]|nr:hypothetical protein [Bacteroidales bacterium]